MRFAPLLQSTLQTLDDRSPISLIDIGSGAGIPGIPLALVFPDLAVTIVEATGKKVNFIDEMVEELGLVNVDVLHARSEDVAHLENYRESFDLAVARAVGSVPTLLELCLPFLRTGGIALFIKGQSVEKELIGASDVARRLGGSATRLHDLPPFEDFGMTRVVVADKIGASPGEYPRRAGLPARNPLGGQQHE